MRHSWAHTKNSRKTRARWERACQRCGVVEKLVAGVRGGVRQVYFSKGISVESTFLPPCQSCS